MCSGASAFTIASRWSGSGGGVVGTWTPPESELELDEIEVPSPGEIKTNAVSAAASASAVPLAETVRLARLSSPNVTVNCSCNPTSGLASSEGACGRGEGRGRLVDAEPGHGGPDGVVLGI